MTGDFWGKITPEKSCYLPLAAHCLDVGLVFRSLCDLDGVRRALQHLHSQPLTEIVLDRLAVLAMIHDVGKANLGFQRKVFDPRSIQAGHIRELAPLLDPEVLDGDLHEQFVDCLSPEIITWFSGPESAGSYLLASFSHHGQPLEFRGERAGTYWHARNVWWRPDHRLDPMAAIRDIVAWGRRAFPRAFEEGGPHLPSDPRFHHRFAGLVMLADWLGSHSGWFPIRPVEVSERLDDDLGRIPDLMKTVGLDIASLRPMLKCGFDSFESRFEFQPRPLQAAVDVLNPADANTQLLIAEAETGSGKTEAALDWFFKLFAEGAVDGLYFALPTRVAAREIYMRVHKTIGKWFPDPQCRPLTVLAVPGYAQSDGISKERLPPREQDGARWQDNEELRRRERQWAVEHPKRFLAAPIAVGTIDQALLSGVQTAHAHLRSVCLDRHLLVVDEVHASDHYMSRLLESLLTHHMGVGGRAMLLSATLGARARHRYAPSKIRDEFTMPDVDTATNIPYPALTFASGDTVGTGFSDQGKEVRFEETPLADRPEEMVDDISNALSAGARIIVVLNTVKRANSLLRFLQSHQGIDPSWLFTCEGVVCPHHGRFTPGDRELLDSQVSYRLGPSSRSGPLLIVGTQTLEQSLDIDADLMITDLAPADVLLQRVGRLQRHERIRPSGYGEARCLVLTPGSSLDSTLDHRGNVASEYKRMGYGSVYEDLRTLELTRRVLFRSASVSIPSDNRRLVEAVTHPELLRSLTGEGDRWALHGQSIEGGEIAHTIAAGSVAAVFDKYFGDFSFNESGSRVAVRLGADRLQLPLDRKVSGPFGRSIREIVIPGHLAPTRPDDVVSVKDVRDGSIILECGDRRYSYSAYGLEEM